MRVVAIALGILAFLALSALVARWLSADGAERARVERLLKAQVRGDDAAMAGELSGCDRACRDRLRVLARRLRHAGDLSIVRYDSKTAHALGGKTAPTRVVWTQPGRLTTVQCVLVRRTGNPLAGPRVTLLRLSAPIGRESSC